MPKNSELPTHAALKAYHIYVIAETARVWSGPVRLGLLAKLLKGSIKIGLRLLVHSSRSDPLCNDPLAFGQSLMVVPAWHCFFQAKFSISLNNEGMSSSPPAVSEQGNPAMHLCRHRKAKFFVEHSLRPGDCKR